MLLDLFLHGFDLGVENGEDRGLGAHGGRVGGRHHRWLAQLLATQSRGDLFGSDGPVAPPRTLERVGDLLDAQGGRRGGVGRRGEQLERVRRGQVLEGRQRGREEVQQRLT